MAELKHKQEPSSEINTAKQAVSMHGNVTKKLNFINEDSISSDSNNIGNFKLKVGYWWSDKKSQRLNVNELTKLFAEKQCQLTKLDFEISLEDQGPFSLIVHKLSDIVVKADQGDLQAKKIVNSFESYVCKHPETIVLDPLENNRVLLDRYKQYRLIEQCDLAREGLIFTPPFAHLTSNNIDVNRGRIRRSKITFPLVCKPILAQGSTGAHQMSIIFNEAGLKDVKPPCVAQSFVNHNARLFKLFVIKDKYYIMERPSLKNFQPGDQETVFFYSHDISKPGSSSSLTELDDLDRLNMRINATRLNGNQNGNTGEQTSETNHLNNNSFEPSKEILDKIVKTFSEKLSLTFYGIDVIIENETSRYAIIDMNSFPGYDGVENFLAVFRDVVCDAIPQRRADVTTDQQSHKILNRRKPTEIDSGIEST